MEKEKLQFGNQSNKKGTILKSIPFSVISIIVIVAALYYFNTNSNKTRKISSVKEITNLADEYQLTNQTGVNNHLSFVKGDLHYWADQNLTVGELETQFAVRKQILESAKKENKRFADQEELADEVEVIIIKKLAKKYNLDNDKIHPSHLILNEGDYSYWRYKNLSLKEIEERFKIMDKILQDAKKNKTPITTKNELGYLVEKELQS